MLDEAVQRVGHDFVAARRQVDRSLEEHIGAGRPRAAAATRRIAAPSGASACVEALAWRRRAPAFRPRRDRVAQMPVVAVVDLEARRHQHDSRTSAGRVPSCCICAIDAVG